MQSVPASPISSQPLRQADEGVGGAQRWQLSPARVSLGGELRGRVALAKAGSVASASLSILVTQRGLPRAPPAGDRDQESLPPLVLLGLDLGPNSFLGSPPP